MGYVSLHGYIRNTPSDTGVDAKHQLRVEGVPDQWKRIYKNHAKLGRTKELGGKTGVLVGLNLPSVGVGTEAGVQTPHWAIV